MAIEQGLGNFGLPMTTQQDLAKQRMVDNNLKAREYAVQAYARPEEQAMFNVGAAAGNALGKMFGGNLSDEERRRFQAKEQSQNEVDMLRQSEDWQTMDADQRSLKVQDISSKALYDHGFVQDAATLGAQAAEKRVAIQKQGMELERLGYQTAEAKQKHEFNQEHGESVMETIRIGQAQGNMGQYYLKTPGGYSAETVTGTIQEDHSLKVGERTIPAGEFSPSVKSVGMTQLDQRRLLNATFSPTAQGKIRDTAKGLAQTTRINNNILRMLGESAQKTGEINFLGGAGKGVGWINSMVNNVKSAFRTADGVSYAAPVNIGGVRQADGSYKGGKNITMNGLAKDRDSETGQALSEAMGKLGYTGDMANKYQSQVMELAYATARANEPGARQLSDADIANALRIIGTNATNPEAMRQIFMDNVSRAVKKHKDNIASVPRDLRHLIITPDLDDRMETELATFAELSSADYGTAEEPSEKLMSIDTAPEHDLSIRNPGMNQAIENARTVTLPGAKTAAPPAQDNDPSGQVAESAVQEAVQEETDWDSELSFFE